MMAMVVVCNDDGDDSHEMMIMRVMMAGIGIIVMMMAMTGIGIL